jgi:SWI/SNF-related matrix-associated actin-dependent regulator of chromatin subfamily B protein 1
VEPQWYIYIFFSTSQFLCVCDPTDPVVTPENFAQTVVEDYNLSANYHAIIVKSINDQLSDFKAHSGLYDGDGAELSSPILGIVGVGLKPGENTLKQGTLDEENEKWWAEWRRRLLVVEKRGGRKTKGRKMKRRRIAPKVEDGAEGDVEDGDGPGMDVETEDDKSMVWERPLPLEEIDVNEQMMHEDMRILIRVSWWFFLWRGGD